MLHHKQSLLLMENMQSYYLHIGMMNGWMHLRNVFILETFHILLTNMSNVWRYNMRTIFIVWNMKQKLKPLTLFAGILTDCINGLQCVRAPTRCWSLVEQEASDCVNKWFNALKTFPEFTLRNFTQRKKKQGYSKEMKWFHFPCFEKNSRICWS